jgi:VanZ family protein
MASSSMDFGSYVTQTSARVSGRLQTQCRAWLPVLACTMLFAMESTACFGTDRTSAPLQRAAEAIFGYGVGVHWNLIHYLLRKTGHFMGCGMFSLVFFRGFWIALEPTASRLTRQLRAHGLAILATFLMASADEFHQCFLPNRFGSFNDVMLDTLGAVAMGLVLFLVMQAVEYRRQVRERASCLKPTCAEAAA